jgi:phage shock protein PspC (stress-responsive transcriptional regulator)
MAAMWLLVLLATLLVGAGVVLLVVLLARRGQTTPAPPNLPRMTEVERASTFRRKGEQFREERSRILEMVESGKVSADEGDRLLGTLERETATMACPFCNEDIRIEAVKCRHCGSYLYEGVSGPKRLTKSRDRMIAGVCGGLAEYLELDPTLVRVLAALVILFTAIVAGLLAYLVAALLLPEPQALAS